MFATTPRCQQIYIDHLTIENRILTNKHPLSFHHYLIVDFTIVLASLVAVKILSIQPTIVHKQVHSQEFWEFLTSWDQDHQENIHQCYYQCNHVWQLKHVLGSALMVTTTHFINHIISCRQTNTTLDREFAIQTNWTVQ